MTNRLLRGLRCIGPHYKVAACRSLRVLSLLKRRRVRNGIDHSLDLQCPNSPAESPCTAFIRATRSLDARRLTKPRMLGETAALRSGTERVLAAVRQVCATQRQSNTISICEIEIEATRTLTTRVKIKRSEVSSTEMTRRTSWLGAESRMTLASKTGSRVSEMITLTTSSTISLSSPN